MDHPTMHICKNTQSFIFDRLTIIYPYQYLKKNSAASLRRQSVPAYCLLNSFGFIIFSRNQPISDK